MAAASLMMLNFLILRSFTPKRHWLVVWIRIVTKFQSNVLAFRYNELFNHPPDRDRRSTAYIHNSVTLRMLDEGNESSSCLFNGEIVSQLLSPRHRKLFIASL